MLCSCGRVLTVVDGGGVCGVSSGAVLGGSELVGDEPCMGREDCLADQLSTTCHCGIRAFLAAVWSTAMLQFKQSERPFVSATCTVGRRTR